LSDGSEGEKKAPKQWADRFGALVDPALGRESGVVRDLMTLEELRFMGPVWVREMLKRRARHTAVSREDEA